MSAALVTLHGYGAFLQVRQLAQVRANMMEDTQGVRDFGAVDVVLQRMRLCLTIAQDYGDRFAPVRIEEADYLELARLGLDAALVTVGRALFDFRCYDQGMHELCAAAGRDADLEWPRSQWGKAP